MNDETRTHGDHSAIDDNTGPAYEQFDPVEDQSQPIPGIDAIPADMPNAEHGDMPLQYDLQTFNALVAANTAMETEISSLNEMLVEARAERDHLKEVIAESLKPTIDALTKSTDEQERIIRDRDNTIAAREKVAEQTNSDLQFAQEQRDVLQRRLDRTLGYLDRVLDEEDGLRSPDTMTERAPKPPVGPAIGAIPDAVRRDKHGRTEMPYATMSSDFISPREIQAGRRRRYG